MRLATFRANGRCQVGRVTDDGQAVETLDPGQTADGSGVLSILRRLLDGRRPEGTTRLPLDRVSLEAPIPRPQRNIFCVGKNYHEHAHEFARSGFDSTAEAGAVPEAPIIFSKVPETVTAPGRPILVDASVSDAIDYEAELAVVIGTGGRGIRREDALDHVWGYTIVNDVTARDLQGRHRQWLIGKSQDSFCPMGPWLVSRDEIDLADTRIRCWVNNELRQDANTRDLIFDVPTLIETISAGLTLVPGDIIATGTPAGVGIGFTPPKYLRPGDVVRIELNGIGVLENPVVAREAAA
jgi:2-keto-4-pentenoate hydratase/2-oxohepta-3-ene-1,7-dioic acid hydratase in catechol pathway